MRYFIRTLLVAATVVAPTCAFAATNIAIVEDGPGARELISLDQLQLELDQLMAGEFEVRIPGDKHVAGDWTLDGAAAVLERLQADPDVDMILTVGVVTSQVASMLKDPKVPVIATTVADPTLQKFPLTGGTSGRHNFTYIADFHSVQDDLTAFRRAVDFERPVVLVDPATLDALPELRDVKAAQLSAVLGLSVRSLAAPADVSGIMRAIPPDADAVYVTPLLRLDLGQIGVLGSALAERKLPSFSLLGLREVEAGLLMGTGGAPNDEIRFLRRLALIIQRILLGEDAADIPVSLSSSARLSINMRTARATGFAPRYAILADANRIDDGFGDAAEIIDLGSAMRTALSANLALSAARYEPRISAADSRIARGQLLPGAGLDAAWTTIDEDRANPLFQAERTLDSTLSASQLIWSDEAASGYAISRYQADASSAGYEAASLDLLRDTGQAYLGLMRALALESVQKSNLEVTRTNLALSRIRESVGVAGRGDVLRWESQIASDRRNFIEAEAARRQSMTRVSQLLNRPQEQPLMPDQTSVRRVMGQFDGQRIRRFIENPTAWATFVEFVVSEALRRAPELDQADQLLRAAGRNERAARRRIWMPRFDLVGQATSTLSRGGAGSDFSLSGQNDTAWAVSVQGSLPLFSGGALRADIDRAGLVRGQAEARTADIASMIELGARISMQRTASSHSAIELTAQSARAASENLELVTDAYSKGAVSVTDLVDAQNAALAAGLSAAEAEYVYLIDVMDVMRAAASFDLLLDVAYQEEWFRRVEAWFAEQGVPLAK